MYFNIYLLGCILALAFWVGTVLYGLSVNQDILSLAKKEVSGLEDENYILMTVAITLLSWIGLILCVMAWKEVRQ